MRSSACAEYIRQAGLSSQLIDQERFRKFQRRNRGVFGHGRKIVQKLVKSLAAFQVV